MATFLDSGILGQFTIIFSFLLVIGIVYGILSFTKLLGNNSLLHGLIAIIAGIFVLISPGISDVISIMVPWLTLFFIFVMFMIMAYKMFGASDHDVMSA